MSFDALLIHRLAVERATSGVPDEYGQPSHTYATLATFRGRIDMGEVDVGEADRPALARASSRPALRTPSRAALQARAEQPPGASENGSQESAGEKVTVAVKPPAPPVPVAMGAMKRKVIVRRK